MTATRLHNLECLSLLHCFFECVLPVNSNSMSHLDFAALKTYLSLFADYLWPTPPLAPGCTQQNKAVVHHVSLAFAMEPVAESN